MKSFAILLALSALAVVSCSTTPEVKKEEAPKGDVKKEETKFGLGGGYGGGFGGFGGNLGGYGGLGGFGGSSCGSCYRPQPCGGCQQQVAIVRPACPTFCPRPVRVIPCTPCGGHQPASLAVIQPVQVVQHRPQCGGCAAPRPCGGCPQLVAVPVCPTACPRPVVAVPCSPCGGANAFGQGFGGFGGGLGGYGNGYGNGYGAGYGGYGGYGKK